MTLLFLIRILLFFPDIQNVNMLFLQKEEEEKKCREDLVQFAKNHAAMSMEIIRCICHLQNMQIIILVTFC